jgi:hypothetical protein
LYRVLTKTTSVWCISSLRQQSCTLASPDTYRTRTATPSRSRLDLDAKRVAIEETAASRADEALAIDRSREDRALIALNAQIARELRNDESKEKAEIAASDRAARVAESQIAQQQAQMNMQQAQMTLMTKVISMVEKN